MKIKSSRHVLRRTVIVLMTPLGVIALVAGSLQALTNKMPPVPPEIALTSPVPGQAASAISHNVEIVGQLGGTVNTVAVQGNIAYVGIGPSLVVFNIANPAHLAVLGQSLPMPDVIANVVVSGTWAYVADDTGGLRIVDVSDLAHPREIGAWTGTAFCVAVAGQYAYVGEGRGMHVIDVSDPASPQHMGFIDTVRGVYGLAVAGHYAYVGATRNVGDYHIGLWVMDVSDPAHPQVIGHVPDVRPFGVKIAGHYAYIADVMYGMRIIDISNPAHPARVGSYYTLGSANKVAVADHYAYIANYYGLNVIDVSEPITPTQTAYYSITGDIEDVAVAGSTAYAVARGNGLHAINVADPADPHEVGFYETPLVSPSNVAVAGAFAYVTEDDLYGYGLRALRIVNVSDPSHPFRVSSVGTPGRARDVAVAGAYIYVADDDAGLRVIYALYVTDPFELSYMDTPGRASGVAVSGNYAYVADESGGLRIIKITHPDDPTEVGAYDTPGNAYDVAVVGNLAYVADGSAGLRIINVADRAHPTEIGFYDTPGDAQGVAVEGAYAYVADGSAGLRIIRVTDPAHPVEVSSISTAGLAQDVAVTPEGLAYVADSYGGLRVVNVTDPAHPTEVGFHERVGDGLGVAVQGDIAYLAGGDGGLSIVRYHPGPPTASFTAYPTSGRCPLTVAFTDTSAGGVDSRLWNFGDGSTSTLSNPIHLYTVVSVYTVSLRAANANGSDTLTRTNYITVTGMADFTAEPRVGRPPLTVTFTNQSMGVFWSSLWDFGDGVTSTLTNPTHTFTAKGVYTVALTVNGPDGEDTQVKPAFITVMEPMVYLPVVMRNFTPPSMAGVRFVAPGGTDMGNDCRISATPCASVQHAVDVAEPGEEIRVAAGTFTGVSVRPRNDIRTDGVVTQVVYLSKTVSLRGGYTPANWTTPDPTMNPTILDAQGQGRVLYVTGDISPTVEGLRITGGNGVNDNPVGLGVGGGVYVISATITFKGCQVYNNTAEWEGGGVYLNRSPATLSANVIHGNSAPDGGGVHLEFSDATLIGNLIQSNTAHRVTTVDGEGGGVYVFASAAVLSGNTVVSNTGYSGGGMYLSSGAATLSGNTISGNTASDGGGVFLVSGSAATWSGNIIQNNTASRGGGLYLWAPTGALLDSNTFRGNRADLGGGVYLIQSDATLVNSIFAHNQADISGSGVYIEAGDSRFVYTTFAHNSGGDGSGVYATNTGWGPGSVALTNTILVSHTVGISVTGVYTVAVNVNGILWFNTPVTVSQVATATVTVQNQYEGDPAFTGSDYHILPTSAAVNQGVAVEYPLDRDGEYRLPAAPPDLGADELIPSPPACAARLNGATVYPSLQAAINASTSASDVIKVAGVCEDTVNWNGSLYVAVLTKTLTVRGGYGPGFVWDPTIYPTVLNGHRWGGALAIGAGASPTVEYLTLLGGQAMEGGGLWSEGAAPVLRHLRLFYNFAGRGGGIYLGGTGGHLEASRIEANRASLGGGLYLKRSGAVSLNGNTLQGNAAIKGGGALLDSTSSATTLSGNTILDNMSEAFGGGVYQWRGDATLSGNTIRNNMSGSFGGGISLDSTSGASTLSGNTVASNTASSGGGVHLGSSAATLSDNTVQNNTAQFGGGGIYLDSSPATLRDNTIVSNTTSYHGGGIYLYTSAATLSGNAVLSNTARNQTLSTGGGIYLVYSAAILNNNTISNNTVKQWGGGIHVEYSPATLISNTLYNNMAHVGGGAYLNQMSNVILTSNIVFSNTTNMTGPGGGIQVANSTITMSSNLVFSNTASGGGGLYLTDSQATLSGNRIFCNVAQTGGGMGLNRSDVTLVNNVITDNQADTGSGVNVEASRPRFLHTTIARNSATGDGDGSGINVTQSSYGWDASVITLTNTMLVSHSVGISMTDGNTLTVNGILWFGTPVTVSQATTATVTMQNQYGGDPAFAPDGYHLTAGSAAIDKGVDAGVSTDIDGAPRPQGPLPDLGAVEYFSSATLPSSTAGWRENREWGGA